MVYEDGGQSRDFISVHDVAETAVRLLGTGDADGRVLNLGSGVAHSIGDIGRTLATLTGREDLQPNVTGQFRRGDVRHCYRRRPARPRDHRLRAADVAGKTDCAELLAWCRDAASVRPVRPRPG